MKNWRKDANDFVEIIRTVVRQELENQNNTAVCIVESVNQDETLNLYVLPDRQNVVTNIINQCRFDFKPGDTALLFKIDNRLSNSFVIAKYDAKQQDSTLEQKLDLLYSKLDSLSTVEGTNNLTPLTDDEYNDLLSRINSLRNSLITYQNTVDTIARKVANVAIVED